MATDIPSLDRNLLGELSAIMEKAFPELVLAFIADADKIVASMHQAVVDGDLLVASQLAHTLKGSSANVGALKLSDLCQKLNAAQREGQEMDFVANKDFIAAELNVVKDLLAQLLQEMEG